MATLVLRLVKGSFLTNQEIDNNFINLNNDIATRLLASTYTASDILTKLKTVAGTGSGLDADTLRTLIPSSNNVNSTIVSRDASGNFSATTITANLTGNASGTASNITGIANIVNGGTGAITAPQALTNLGASPIASPAFTGTPTAPTPAYGTNSTQISTTAYGQANFVTKTTQTGSSIISTGTTAQRDPSPFAGYFRYNLTTTAAEIYNGTAWSPVGGGATGSAGDTVFVENSRVVTSSYTLSAGKNASCVGPLQINSGATVTIPSGARLVVL